MTLAVDLGGVRLPGPVLGASGTVGSGQELSRILDLGRIGGIVTKSVTARPVRGLATPRMVETSSGMLNAIGLQNPGLEGFLLKDGPWIARAGVPVIVSIAGKTVQEFAEVAVEVSRMTGVAAIEANISCPNVEKRGLVFACDPASSTDVIGTLTRMTNLPVFAKLTADVTNIVEIAETCVRAGARGLTLINTLLGMAINVDTGKPRLAATTGGLSGPAMRPIAVRCIYQVAQALPEVPIMGVGGVVDARSAVELMLAGAWAVQVGTANFSNPQVMGEISDGIASYLQAHGMRHPAELRGRLSGAPPPEPAFQGSG